jgi:hypothetical protein
VKLKKKERRKTSLLSNATSLNSKMMRVTIKKKTNKNHKKFKSNMKEEVKDSTEEASIHKIIIEVMTMADNSMEVIETEAITSTRIKKEAQ